MSQRKKKNRWLVPSLIVLVLAAGGAGYYYINNQKTTANNETGISTSTIGTGDIILSATGPGTLIPSEEVSFGFELIAYTVNIFQIITIGYLKFFSKVFDMCV